MFAINEIPAELVYAKIQYRILKLVGINQCRPGSSRTDHFDTAPVTEGRDWR
jgi:hypothetical protein